MGAVGSPPGLLEREAELAELEHAFGRAAAGAGSLIVVTGSAGSGKTALLEGARALAPGQALSARGAEFEADFPFGIVRQLFDRVTAERSDWGQGPGELAAQRLRSTPAAAGTDAAAGAGSMFG